MIEPWNIKQEDTRQADSLPTFIIFCEDEVSEPFYFSYFETPLIKVNPIKNQKSKIDNVLNAIEYCDKYGLMELKDNLLCLQNKEIQVWCVFDRDIETNVSEIPKHNISFNMSIDNAIRSGFKVAWSNDAFELWILLHFEDIDVMNENYKSRKTYYERLTEIFKSLPLPNEDLSKALSHQSFSYKKDCKSKNNFKDIVLNEIVSKTEYAIKRAKILEEYHNASTKPDHEKSPCTLVHHLVEELIILGRKEA
jgi:hypothetical protein